MFQWYVNEKRLRTFSVYATSIFQLMHASCLSCVYKGSGKTVFKASLSLTQMSLFTFLFPYLCNVLFFFLHGGGFSGLTWALLSSQLVQRIECRCYCMDIRGHGSIKIWIKLLRLKSKFYILQKVTLILLMMKIYVFKH